MNAYQKYKEKYSFYVGMELVLLLFEEADKRLARAGYALEDKDYGNFDKAKSDVYDCAVFDTDFRSGTAN